MVIIIFILTSNPFNEANFTAIAYRSISIFSNPAGIGITPGAELFFTYRSEKITSGIILGNFGFGISRTKDLMNYELGGGIKLPGVFSLGYAYQFGDTTEHIIGLIANFNRYFSVGYRKTLGRKKIMEGGFGLRLFANHFIFAGDIKYQGIDDTIRYFLGCILKPVHGVKLNFYSDIEFNWHAGIVLERSKFKIGILYSRPEKKFSGGIIISLHNH